MIFNQITQHIPSMVINGNLVLTQHALNRKYQRDIDIIMRDNKYYINNREITIGEISRLPFVRDNGCVKFYDDHNNVSWYVRKCHITNEYKIMTIVKHNKIAIFRRIITDVYHWNFNEYCRDYTFGTCQRGCRCRYKHIDLDNICRDFHMCGKCDDTLCSKQH